MTKIITLVKNRLSHSEFQEDRNWNHAKLIFNFVAKSYSIASKTETNFCYAEMEEVQLTVNTLLENWLKDSPDRDAYPSNLKKNSVLIYPKIFTVDFPLCPYLQ